MQVKSTPKGRLLAKVAPLLEYPDKDYFNLVEELCAALKDYEPKILKRVLEFKKAISGYTVSDLEELYTKTFDVAPVCSPYVSVHIYGDENFDRGNLMATLSSKFQERGFNATKELPDHLAVLLRFSSLLSEEEIGEMEEFCLREPVKHMSNSLKGTKVPNPFYYPVHSVLQILESR